MHITRECPWCSRIQFNDCRIDTTEDGFSHGRKKLDPNITEHERGTWTYPVDLAIYDSFPALPRLAEASRSGCPFGGFLKDVLESSDVQYQLQDDISDFEGRFIPFKLVFAYTWGVFEAGAGNSGLEALRITLHLDTVEGSAHDKVPPFQIVCRVHKGPDDSRCSQWLGIERSYIIPQLGDEKAMDWMKYQLAECDEKRGPHLAHCGLEYTEGFLPNRLIDLQSSTLQLVSRADVIGSVPSGDPIPRYAALSYCWGLPRDAANQLMLFSSFFTQKRFAFQLHDLPAVIRDAVAVARSLSLRYLWVDALCILQDNQLDWEVESSQMDKIYGCSYITICSLTASCNLSFLTPERQTTTIDFRSRTDPAIWGQYSISYSYFVSLRSGAGILVDRLMENRWSRRGWTFQEAFLSARLLCFEQSDISFSCYDRVAYMSGHTGARPLESLPMLQADVQDPHESVWAFWYQWVLTGYCDRSFTRPDDVFPAISGVAEVFKKIFGAKYVAGLWDTDLAIGLMWEVDAERHRGDISRLISSQQPTTLTGLLTALSSGPYVSPSWSWAGRQAWVDSPIVSYSQVWKNVRDEGQTVASVFVAGSNPFGRLEAAWIEFTGTVVNIGPNTPMVPSGKFPGHYTIDLQTGGSVTCRFDWYIHATALHGRFKMILLGSFIESPETDDPDSLPDENQSVTESVLRERTAFGIIIHQDPRSDAFFRVGVFFSLASKGGDLRYFDSYEIESLKII